MDRAGRAVVDGDITGAQRDPASRAHAVVLDPPAVDRHRLPPQPVERLEREIGVGQDLERRDLTARRVNRRCVQPADG